MPPAFEDIRMPKWQEIEKFVKDPELLTAEVLFLILTLGNVFIMFKIFQDVAPFPIFVTWFQLAQGLFMAYILGETGKEFPKLAYFPRVEANFEMMKKLFLPTIFYCAMLVLANVLLSLTQCVATYPVIVSFTVVLHHLTRFLGCGEEYFPMRWQSLGLLTLAFLLGCTDPYTISLAVLPFALLFAGASAAFRAGYLQKLMHMVDGRGNALHNNQHLIGVCVLPIFVLLFGEYRVFWDMPSNIFSARFYLVWGCLVTAGALPFMKNVVSNRLIKRTGQGPWRILEVASVALLFLIGLSFGSPGFQGYICILLVIMGRGLGACDVLMAQAQMENAESRGGGYANFIGSDISGQFDSSINYESELKAFSDDPTSTDLYDDCIHPYYNGDNIASTPA